MDDHHGIDVAVAVVVVFAEIYVWIRGKDSLGNELLSPRIAVHVTVVVMSFCRGEPAGYSGRPRRY